ncbi:GntR family transcriptional regulator, partial [Corynebacterium pseudodiphtheriticum]
MDLGIDRQALVPVVQQIVCAVTQWIRTSGITPGTRLPSVRQLALDNLLSQSSVVEAFDRLVAQGLLVSKQGSGFVVAQPSVLHENHWYEGAERGWGAYT